jgi:uncharacterized protein YuzE
MVWPRLSGRRFAGGERDFDEAAAAITIENLTPQVPPFDKIEPSDHLSSRGSQRGFTDTQVVEMRIVFANPTPVEYNYDKKGDVLYLTFARQKTTRTLEILKDWPMLLADLNDQNQIIGLEYVGYKQFGIETFKRLVLERLRGFGIELGEQESEFFVSFTRTPEAELALSR